MSTNENQEPWDRQPEETAKAYAAFCAFRNAGPTRELPSVYRHYTGKKQAGAQSGQWSKWFTDNKWRERAEAWDDYQDKLYQKERIDAVKEMRKRWITISSFLQKKTLDIIKSPEKGFLDDAKPKDLIRLLTLALKVEGKAIGEITGVEARIFAEKEKKNPIHDDVDEIIRELMDEGVL